MLKFNLDKLLTDRHESISELSRDTGLSRKTLTQLSNNDSKGIQLNTLQKLMEHFNLPIESFFIYRHEEVFISIIDFDPKKNTVPIIIEDNKNLKLLQILILNDDTREAKYIGYPIIVKFLESDDKNSPFAIYVLGFDADSFDSIHKLSNDDFKSITNQFNEVSKILSKLSDAQIFNLFFSILFISSEISKRIGIAPDDGFTPLIVNCFGIQKAEFLPMEKDTDGEKIIIPKKEFDDTRKNTETMDLEILTNKDLFKLLKNVEKIE